MFIRKIAKNVAMLLVLLLAFSTTTAFAHGRVIPTESVDAVEAFLPLVSTTGPSLVAPSTLVFNHSIPRDLEVTLNFGEIGSGYEATGITSVMIDGTALPSSDFTVVGGVLTVFSNWFLVNTFPDSNVTLVVTFNDNASTLIHVPVVIVNTRIAVAHGGHDNVAQVLNRLQISYYFLPSGTTHRLNNPAFINSFDMVFIPCGAASINASVVRDFVANGGILYASDLVLGSVVTSAFPEMQFSIASASAQTTPGHIVDDGLAAQFSQRFFSDQLNIIYNLGGWQFVTSWNQDSDMNILIEGPIVGRTGTYPFAFTFSHGLGQVLYVSFHTHVQASEQMNVILDHLIRRVVMDDYISDNANLANNYGFSTPSPLIGTIPPLSFMTWTFLAQAGQSFIVINNINLLSNFTLTISGPNGVTFTINNSAITPTGISPAFEAFLAQNDMQLVSSPNAQGMIVHNPSGGQWTVRLDNNDDIARDFVLTVDGFEGAVIPRAPRPLLPWEPSVLPPVVDEEYEEVEGPLVAIINGIDVDIELVNRRVSLELPVTVANEIIRNADDGIVSVDLTMQEFDSAIFPTNVLRRFADAGLAVEMHLPLGTVVFDVDAIYSLAAQAVTRFTTLSLTRVALYELSEAQYEAIEGKDVALFQVTIDDGRFSIGELEGQIIVSVYYINDYPSSVWTLDYYGVLELVELLEVDTVDLYYVTEYDEEVELQIATFVLDYLGVFVLGVA
jgi:hypothetical protein